MTRHRSVRHRHAPDPRPDRLPARIAAPTPEEVAIESGVRAGDAALARFGSRGALVLFMGHRPSPDMSPKLEALRSYAELKRALLRQGRHIPASSLAAAGYTAAEIARFDAAIAAASSDDGPSSDTNTHPTRREND